MCPNWARTGHEPDAHAGGTAGDGAPVGHGGRIRPDRRVAETYTVVTGVLADDGPVVGHGAGAADDDAVAAAGDGRVFLVGHSAGPAGDVDADGGAVAGDGAAAGVVHRAGPDDGDTLIVVAGNRATVVDRAGAVEVDADAGGVSVPADDSRVGLVVHGATAVEKHAGAARGHAVAIGVDIAIIVDRAGRQGTQQINADPTHAARATGDDGSARRIDNGVRPAAVGHVDTGAVEGPAGDFAEIGHGTAEAHVDTDIAANGADVCDGPGRDVGRVQALTVADRNVDDR